MNITDAKELTLLHMEDHGLIGKHWCFEFEHCKRSLGRCHYDSKKITLSKWYVELNEEEDVEDTILHEIAHALTFLTYGREGKGHGVLWKRMCRKIGAKPNTTHQGVIEYPKNHYKYSSTCCGHTWGKHRMSKGRRYICPKCNRILVFKTKNKSLTYA